MANQKEKTVFCPKCGTENSNEARYCTSCGESLATLTQATPQVETDGQARSVRQRIHYAGFWQRVIALFLDFLIIMFIASVLAMPFNMIMAHSMMYDTGPMFLFSATYSVDQLTYLLFSWLYFTLMESSSWQATVGKRALGLKVTDENGQRISWARANGRYFGKMLSTAVMGFGYLMVAFTAKKQALHDILAGTLVFKDAA